MVAIDSDIFLVQRHFLRLHTIGTYISKAVHFLQVIVATLQSVSNTPRMLATVVFQRPEICKMDDPLESININFSMRIHL